MDLSKARVEPFLNLLRFHNEFNDSVKLTYASLSYMKSVSQELDGELKVTNLIDSVGNPWGKGKRIPSVIDKIGHVEINYAGMALVEVMASFEGYLVNSIAACNQFSDHFNSTYYPHVHSPSHNPEYLNECCLKKATEKADKKKAKNLIGFFQNQLGIVDLTFKHYLALFQYFRTVRNCFAHGGGRASDEYVTYSISQEFKDAVTFWGNKSSGLPPNMPVVSAGEMITLEVTNSIMASAVCYNIGIIINGEMVKLIGEEGFLKMSLHYSMICKFHEHQLLSHDIVISPIQNFLNSRYNIPGKKDDVIKRLKHFNLWDQCVARFHEKYP
jgi:hypothetical protein